MNKSSVLIFAVAAILAMSAGVWLGQSNKATNSLKPEKIQGVILPEAKAINDFNLLNHLGEKINKASFTNHWSLIFIGYTHCPDICPTTLTLLNQVDGFMREQKFQAPEFIFMSIDPERDTVESMNEYVKYFNKDFTGLTGSLDQITQFSQQLSAYFRKAAGGSGDINADDYLMDHSSTFMLINPQGNLQAYLTAPHLPGTIIESILKSQAYYEIMNKQ